MKKTKLLMLVFMLSFLAVSTMLLLNAKATTTRVSAVSASLLDDVQVDSVDHHVGVLAGGTIMINDTVQLSAKPGKTVSLTEYPLGFPYGFSSRLAQVFAFNTSNPQQAFSVSLDTGIDNSSMGIGFYGVTVMFPLSGVQLSDGGSFRFTVVFVFSNVIESSTYTEPNDEVPPRLVTNPVFTLDFPTYPSLPQNVSSCNVSVSLPPNIIFTGSSLSNPQPSGTIETGQTWKITTPLLAAFSYVPGWFNFTSSEEGLYRVISFDALDRQMDIDGYGNLFVTDTYTITSYQQQSVSGFRVRLPKGASNVSALDIQDSPLSSPALVDANTTTYSVSLGFALAQGESGRFKLTYHLSSADYITKAGTYDFVLNLPVTRGMDRVASIMALQVVLPEGASIKQYPNLEGYSLQNDALQQDISLTAYNVTALTPLDLNFTYTYSVFWSSFRPTLWMLTIVVIGMAIALAWQAPKRAAVAPLPGVSVKPQTLKNLISSYEERTKMVTELESLDRQAQKGKLPRRRYKVRKRILESQLSRLDRDLVDMRQKAKSMGPRYAEILKDLDIAEAELEGVEAELKRTEARYRSGALSLDAYRRLQDQYNKRKEKAKTTIEGALLRLSEGLA